MSSKYIVHLYSGQSHVYDAINGADARRQCVTQLLINGIDTQEIAYIAIQSTTA